jgi:Uri superfamily endonuclease
MRVCSKCKVEKSLEEFNRCSAIKVGYRYDCKKCCSAIKKIWYENNADKVIKYAKKYKLLHPGRAAETQKARYDIDISFKLAKLLRARINRAIFKNIGDSNSAVRDLGCTISELKQHLESKFEPGMTWDNWGKYGWHIDHIRPLSKFDLADRVQFLKACHYANLQPLWAIDNLRKGSK